MPQCLNLTMDDPAVAALVELLRREGGEAVVGAVINANPKSLYQIASGRRLKSGKPKGVGRQLREKLERHYPGWLSLASTALGERPAGYAAAGKVAPLNPGSARTRIPLQARIAPPKIGWEALSMSDLPPEFETELPDNAMAPEAPRGTRCIFITACQPEPGDWVLLRDAGGRIHCREYRVLPDGQWEAHAINRAFLPMRSHSDDLEVLAVFDGHRGRKSAR